MAEFFEEIKSKRKVRCKNCNHPDVMKNGKIGDIQYFRCKKCDHRFSGTNTYLGYRYDKNVMNQAFTYFYGGMSFGIMSNAFEELEI